MQISVAVVGEETSSVCAAPVSPLYLVHASVYHVPEK